MKNLFKKGDRMEYRRKVMAEDQAIFHGELLHPVCATFSLARDFEWTSRLFFLQMKEEDEEGVGTLLHIEHKSPAFVDEEITYTATIEHIGTEFVCTIEARVKDRLIAVGKTGQKMLKKQRLATIFSKR
jgi:fluoroacetyl-CoA thioesterase